MGDTPPPVHGASPEGTTGVLRPPVTPSGLRGVGHGVHGLTPVATTYRPCGTGIPGEPGGQFKESTRLEEAIKSNLEALGYGI